MSSRLVRIDAARLDALVFRTESVRFEACPSFRAGVDTELCECGWLEADHTVAVTRRQFRGLRSRRRHETLIARQTA